MVNLKSSKEKPVAASGERPVKQNSSNASKSKSDERRVKIAGSSEENALKHKSVEKSASDEGNYHK